MRKIIALRVKNSGDVKSALLQKNAEFIDSAIEKKNPAFRHLIRGLQEKGLQERVDGCLVVWCMIDDAMVPEEYLLFNEVEVCFTEVWWNEHLERHRFLSGVAYCAAIEKLSNWIAVKNQLRLIDYHLKISACYQCKNKIQTKVFA